MTTARSDDDVYERNTRRRDAYRALVWTIAGCVVAVSCGSADSTATTTFPDDSTATTTGGDGEIDGSDPSTTVAPDTGDSSTSTTAGSSTTAAPTTSPTTTPESTTTGPSTSIVSTEIDESPLALVEANLYSIPGATTPCEIALRPMVTYLFPADGGDLYAVCIINLEQLDIPLLTPGRLRISPPGGPPGDEVTVDVSGDVRSDVPAFAEPLVLTFPNGERRAHGVDIVFDPTHILTIPILLPHDRQAGTWTIDYQVAGIDHTFTFEIDRPCADAATGIPIDPLRVGGDLDFAREAPVPFPTCRAMPSVFGATADDARATIDEFASRQGMATEYFETTECGGGGVLSQRPGVGEWDWSAINRRSLTVSLTVGITCPPVPSLVPLLFEEVVVLLNALALEFPGFTWTADEGCVPGTIVVTQDPPLTFPAERTAHVDLVRCA